MRSSSILALALLLPLLASPSFGAPADDPRPVVPASEILAKIERGEPVEYDGVIVVGDLDLSGLDLPTKHVKRELYEIEVMGLTEDVKLVESSIRVRNSEIRGGVNLGDAIFQEPVSFGGTNFTKGTWFSRANFSRCCADFYKAEFSGGDAYFIGTEFSGGHTCFIETEFSGGDAYFIGADFSGDTSFFRVDFSGGDAYFIEAEFSGGDADFCYAVFSGDTSFSRVDFSGGDADFSYAVFSGEANFGGANFDEDLDLTGLEFETLVIEWDSINHLTCESGITYLALIKNLKEMDQFDGANNCYYQYRRWKMTSKMADDIESSRLTRRLVDLLAWLSCGFGVKPLRPLALGLFVVVACAVCYWKRNAIRRHEKEGDHQEANFWDAFYFSMMTFTTVGYGDWYPSDEYRRLVMFEGILGWLMLSLFLVTLARVMIP